MRSDSGCGWNGPPFLPRFSAAPTVAAGSNACVMHYQHNRARLADGDDEPGHIRIAATSEGERIVISVADNGIGLPAEHRHRLTEPYVTTRAKGTGLGLAIVRKIVEDHGGEIALADRGEEAKGAEIRLVLPLRQHKAQGVETGNANEQERIVDRA